MIEVAVVAVLGATVGVNPVAAKNWLPTCTSIAPTTIVPPTGPFESDHWTTWSPLTQLVVPAAAAVHGYAGAARPNTTASTTPPASPT